MNRPAICLVCLCLAAGSLAAAEAQTATGADADDYASLKARIAQLEEIVATLETRLDQMAGAGHMVSDDQAPSGTPAVSPSDVEAPWMTSAFWPSRGWNAAWLQPTNIPIALRAYFDLEYIDAEEDGSRGGVSTFDNHHVQVFLDAQLSPRITTHVELEWEHGGDVVEVDSAFADIAIRPDLFVRVGRFYAPFGIERFVGYSPTNALVSRPDVFRELVPNNFYSDGLMFAGSQDVGETNRFAWEAAVSNGLGTDALRSRRGSRQTRDDNSNSALTGRVAWVAPPRFEVGASAHHQRYSADDATSDLDLTFLGVDLAWRWNGFELRSEKVWTELERFDAPALEEEGWYGQLSYLVQWPREWFADLLLSARAETLDFDVDAPGGDLDILSLGLNATIAPHVRVKAEHQWRDSASDLDADRWLFQTVVDF